MSDAEAERRAGFRARMAEARAYCMAGRGTSEATQSAIAKRAGLGDAAVSRYFKGRIPESLAVLEALAGAMGVDPGWLAFGPHTAAPMPATPPSAGALERLRQGIAAAQRKPRPGDGSRSA